MNFWKILVGPNVERLKEIPDGTVQTCVTSPPYWGLRDYGTGTWEGGDPACTHEPDRAMPTSTLEGGKTTQGQARVFLDVCELCGARRVDRQIGLESSHDLYVAAIADVFAEVFRVLRSDGTLWVNLGDTYCSIGGIHDGRDDNQPNVGARVWRDGSGRADGIVDGRGQRNRNGSAAPGLKAKDMIGIPWRVAFALQGFVVIPGRSLSDWADDLAAARTAGDWEAVAFVEQRLRASALVDILARMGWYLRADVIWCLSGGARVYARTQKGDMPMSVKDLVRLDPSTVKLWNGEKWTQVLGWSESPDPRDGALEIELRSGERVGCTPGHVWPTRRGNVRTDALVPGDVIQTTKLPEPDAPVEATALDDDVAWLCGLYLADGSMSGETVQLSGHTDETDARLMRLESVARRFHGTIRVHPNGGQCATICMDGPIIASVIRTYIHGDSAQTKGIKSRAWQRTDQFLRSMLDGYLSGDGHFDESGGRWRLGFTRNDRLAADLRTLAARLGLSMRLVPCEVSGFGREWPAYRGDIRTEPTTHNNAREDGEVIAIRPGRGRKFWDIGVEDDPHLFALASGVLTHNSKPNPMPESVTDRPTKSHEYIFLFAKSGSPKYWTHRDRPYRDGVYAKPDPDYRWKNNQTNDETAVEPTDWKDAVFVDERKRERKVWQRVNLWRGNDYYFDAEAIYEPYAECTLEEIEEDYTGESLKFDEFAAASSVPLQNPSDTKRRIIDSIRKRTGGREARDLHRNYQKEPTRGEGYGAAKAVNGRMPDRDGGFGQPMVGRNKRSVWAVATQPYRKAHFATYSEKLIEPCILASSQPGDIVIDVFNGSGTTGVVATGHDRHYIGFELNPKYYDLSRERIGALSPLFTSEASDLQQLFDARRSYGGPGVSETHEVHATGAEAAVEETGNDAPSAQSLEVSQAETRNEGSGMDSGRPTLRLPDVPTAAESQ